MKKQKIKMKPNPDDVKKVVDNVIKNIRGKHCRFEGECDLAGNLKNTRFCAPCSYYR